MTPAGLLLLLIGLALIVVGAVRIRGPMAAYRDLVQTQANLRRYDEWRGSRVGSEPGVTGADEMMRQLRRRQWLWGSLIGIGGALVLAGLTAR